MIAIIITIMVLELRVPRGDDLEALIPLWPVFLSYVLVSSTSVSTGIHHHHVLHSVTRVTGGVLSSNPHLLFGLSLMPFANAAAIGLAFVHVAFSLAIYVGVSMMWFVPDRRFER